MKLIITGGHPAPALACIDEVTTSNPEVSLVFVGRQYSSDESLSYEYKEVTRRSIRFINLTAGRLTRIFSFRSLYQLVLIPAGFWHAYRILRKERPDKILSFGSYIGLPIAIVGYMLGIPVYTHEQTIHPGLANRIIAIFARKIFLSFEGSKRYFRSKNMTVTGNPVRKQIFKKIKDPFTIKKTRPVIYITGGSLGSHSINLHIKHILHNLLEKYIVIHQTGNVQEFDDYGALTEYRAHLPIDMREYYYPVQHVMADEIGFVYSLADLVVARAGANTFFELVNLKKPAVFIPLPWSANGEQKAHAELFHAWGTGEVFDQDDTSEKLLSAIETVMENIENYRHNFNTIHEQTYQHSATHILKEVLED